MASEVSPYELAVLVLGYLHGRGYSKTAASFKREAKEHFGGGAAAGPPPAVRDLLDLLNDYVRLKEAEARRLALAGRSNLAARLLDALDEEAGNQPAAAVAERAQGAAPAAGLAPTFAGGGVPGGLEAAALMQEVTPGRQRKGAPRKRHRGLDGLPSGGWEAGAEGPDGGADVGAGPAGVEGPSWSSPLHLLDLPLDAEGLEALLGDGPLQLRFAENLAQHINDNLGAAQQGQQGPGCEGAACGSSAAADASPGAGFVAELLADPQTLLAELPGDPRMAEVLQTVVRPAGTAASFGADPLAPVGRPSGRPRSAAEVAAAQEAAAVAVAAATSGSGRGRRQKPRPARRDSRASSLQDRLALAGQLEEQGLVAAGRAGQAVVAAAGGPAAEVVGLGGVQPDCQQQGQVQPPEPPPPQQHAQPQPLLQQQMEGQAPVLLPDVGGGAGSEQQEPAANAEDHVVRGGAAPVVGRQTPQEAEPGGPSAAAAASAATEGPRPRGQQALMDSRLSPAGSHTPAVGKTVGSLPIAPDGVACVEAGLHAAAAAAEALNAAAAGLGPLDLPASEDQLLQDVDELF